MMESRKNDAVGLERCCVGIVNADEDAVKEANALNLLAEMQVSSIVYGSAGANLEILSALHADVDRGAVVGLPQEETGWRLEATTPQWPIMHAVLYGVTRDQMMARHKANHIQVAYAPTAENANRALTAKTALLHEMGIRVHLAGDVRIG